MFNEKYNDNNDEDKNNYTLTKRYVNCPEVWK
jgi:hypothetical protein